VRSVRSDIFYSLSYVLILQFCWVLKGKVILKTNAMEIQEINGVPAPVLRAFTFEKHELMIIPGDIAYSLENRTDENVRIGYCIAP